MKIKLSDLLVKKEALQKLIEIKLPVKASFKLSRSIRIINTELTEYETVRNDLIKKYGKVDENGQGTILPNTPEMAKFTKDLEPILNEELDLNIEPISVKDLGHAEIESMHMINLLDFVIKE